VTSYQLAAGDPLTLLHFGEATTVSPAPTPCPAAHHRCRRSDPGLRPRPNPQAGNHGAAATEVASTRGKDHREWGRDPVDIRAYGRFTADGRTVRASRFLWTAHHGPLPPNTVVMHQVCDEPSCMRLADVRAGSQAENLATAARRDRSSGWRHTGRADRRGMAARSRAIRAALAGGYDPDRLAAVLTAGDCPRPPGPVGRAVLTGLRPTLAAWIAAEHSGPRRTTAPAPQVARARCSQGLGAAPPRSWPLWHRQPVLLPLLAAGDLSMGLWLLRHAHRTNGWDRPGVPVVGVLLLICAVFLTWLAGGAAPRHSHGAPVSDEHASARLTRIHLVPALPQVLAWNNVL